MANRIRLEDRYVVTVTVTKEAVIALLMSLEDAGYASVTLQILRAAASGVGASSDASSLAELLNAKASADKNAVTLGMSEDIASDIVLPAERALFYVGFHSMGFLRVPSTFCHLKAIYRSDDRPPAVDRFYSEAHNALARLEMIQPDTEFSTREPDSPEVPRIDGLQAAKPAGQKTLAAARALGDVETRKALLDVKRATLSTVDELVEGRAKPAKMSGQKLSELVDTGLLQVEYAVLCKGTSTRVYASKSREDIQASESRCLQCGQLIPSHDVFEIATTTSLCDRLLAKSQWMRILVVHTLLEHEIPPDHILVPPEDAGSDDLDLAFLHERSFIVAELKDRDFGQGDASNFAIRLKQIGEAHEGLVIVTGCVDTQAKNALETMFPTGRATSLFEKKIEVHILEGPDSVESQLPRFLVQQHIGRTVAHLGLCGPCAGLDMISVVRSKLDIS